MHTERRLLGAGRDGDVEVALLEAKRAQLFNHRLAQLRNELAALRGKLLAGAQNLRVQFRERGIDAVQLLVPLLQTLKFARRVIAIRNDVSESRAVLPLERVHEI